MAILRAVSVQMPVLLVLMATSVLAWVGNDASDVCGKYSDGCSIPFGFHFFFEDLFTEPCYHHDVCYGCGAQRNVSRDECDSAFLANMKASCAARNRRQLNNPRRRSLCSFTAQDMYYAAVHIFAASHYFSPDAPEFYCGEDWVSSCMPRS